MDRPSDQGAYSPPKEVTAPEVPDVPVVAHGSVRSDLINVVRGFCMGAADTVPGVSGGTVALILGHYRRLVTAISHVDAHALSLLLRRDLSALARHIDLRFLVALAAGILSGVALLAGVMHWLLDHHHSETFAVFLGLMLASVWIVKDYVDQWTAARVLGLLAGAAAAVGITMLPMAEGNMSLPFLFVSASVAICAMILPGISGAFVLLLLGVYHPVTGLIKDAVRGNITVEAAIQIGVFGSGCVIGLLAFSRGLRWLLEHHQGGTMATLMGLMIGSLGKLWPLQLPTAETAELEPKLRVFQYVSPENYPGSVTWLVALVVVAALTVCTMEWVAKK